MLSLCPFPPDPDSGLGTKCALVMLSEPCMLVHSGEQMSGRKLLLTLQELCQAILLNAVQHNEARFAIVSHPFSPTSPTKFSKMHFVLSVSVVSGGFVSRRQAQPFQCTLSGFYLPCVFPSHLRKYKMCCFRIFVKALKQNLLRLASSANACWWCFAL